MFNKIHILFKTNVIFNVDEQLLYQRPTRVLFMCG